PDELGLPTQSLDRLDDVVLAVGSREDHHAHALAHAVRPPAVIDPRSGQMLMSASSMTGLANRRRHSSSISARAAASSAASTSRRIALPTRTSSTPSKPRAGSARSIVAP